MGIRLLHISDTHGALYPLRATRVAAIVHSGDLFPNSGAGPGERLRSESNYQENWIRGNAKRLANWTQGLPFLYCTGNHDYTDGEQALRDAGVNATCLNDRIVTFADRTFYGFPWTPAHLGTNWNDKLLVPQMADRVAAIPEVDVLVSHGPLAGILDDDGYGVSAGCTVMRNAFDSRSFRLPTAYLCGHIHESNGVTSYDGMTVSNAATTQIILEI